jgi:hypothetical protein
MNILVDLKSVVIPAIFKRESMAGLYTFFFSASLKPDFCAALWY